MKFAKDNPIFTAIVTLCVIAAIAGGVLSFLSLGKVSDAESKMKSAESQLRSQLSTEPSPTEDNLKAVEANLRMLEAQLDSYTKELSKGGDSARKYQEDVSVFPLYVDRFRKEYIDNAKKISERIKGGSQDDDADKRRSLFVAEDNFFGFQRFRESPPPAEHVDRVYLQTLVVQYMLDKLFDTIEEGDDVDLISVLREPVYDIPVELKANNSRGNTVPVKDGMFIVSDVITAKTPGAIDTMAFKVVFNGRTNNLRGFLKAIATEGKWPLVVRSVEVEPAQAITTGSVSDASASANDIFALFGGSSSSNTPDVSTSAADFAKDVTIVDKTVSKFTITLEYIEIIKDVPQPEMPMGPDSFEDEGSLGDE